jgi:hypothetical protein
MNRENADPSETTHDTLLVASVVTVLKLTSTFVYLGHSRSVLERELLMVPLQEKVKMNRIT